MLPGCIDWDKIWESIHKQFYTEDTKSVVWDQIHLNFYTTYSYNKWQNSLQPCPLCNKIPEDIFHIITDCRFTKTMWRRIERVLIKIIPIPVTDSEKAFGIQPRRKKETNATTLRNWVTFFMRHQIMLEEREAYHINKYHQRSVETFFTKFNRKALEELKTKKIQYEHRNLSVKFENIATTSNAIATMKDGNIVWMDVM